MTLFAYNQPPHAGRRMCLFLVPGYEHHGIRRCPFRDYLIFYRIEDERIDIVHILHDARDYEPLLFPET
jgi:toxin ParE1/3/4